MLELKPCLSLFSVAVTANHMVGHLLKKKKGVISLVVLEV